MTPYMLYTIHCDCKLVPQFQNKYQKVEILLVLVSSGLNTKLLWVPSFTSDVKQFFGSIIGDFSSQLLSGWKCSVDGSVSMVFDTTSTNTGL